MKQSVFSETLKEQFETKVRPLWPAIKGSLAKVKKPCIRKNCRACARGDKHPAWLLSYSEKGRRKCKHVPKDLVPLLQQALKNGRRLEALLYATGPALLKNRHRHPLKS
jgi:hypothetical protein